MLTGVAPARNPSRKRVVESEMITVEYTRNLNTAGRIL